MSNQFANQLGALSLGTGHRSRPSRNYVPLETSRQQSHKYKRSGGGAEHIKPLIKKIIYNREYLSTTNQKTGAFVP
jgi:hypothetical protein